jgi:hypothetical protein
MWTLKQYYKSPSLGGHVEDFEENKIDYDVTKDFFTSFTFVMPRVTSCACFHTCGFIYFNNVRCQSNSTLHQAWPQLYQVVCLINVAVTCY